MEYFMTVKVMNLTLGGVYETFQIHAGGHMGDHSKTVFSCLPKGGVSTYLPFLFFWEMPPKYAKESFLACQNLLRFTIYLFFSSVCLSVGKALQNMHYYRHFVRCRYGLKLSGIGKS